MKQRLNHPLLYKKYNCIRIMSLNTYNKNADIIWYYCIISQIKLHGFWKRSAFTNMKKDALKYMINRLWYGIFHITCHINPQPMSAIGPSALGLIWASRVDMMVLDWIDNWDIVTLCFITPIKEVCLNWQNFIGYRYRWLKICWVGVSPRFLCRLTAFMDLPWLQQIHKSC